MAENRKPELFYGYIVVAASLFIGALVWGTNRSFGVFFEPIINEFGWTRAGISGAFTLSFAIIGVLAIIAGRLTDRFGPRIVVTACGAFVGLGYLLMSQIETIGHLYLVYGVIVGIGLGAADVPMLSTISRWFVKRRGLMTGVMVAGSAVGITILPTVVSWLISNYGWRISYAILGSAVLVLVISAAQFLRRDPAQMGLLPYGVKQIEGESSGSSATGFPLRDAISSPQFWMLGAVYFCNSYNHNFVYVHIVIHATDVGILPLTAASILSATAAVSIAGRIMAGGMADRIGGRRTVIASFILTLAAFVLLMAGKEAWTFYAFAVIFGLSGFAVGPLVSVLVAELFGTRAHGVIFASVWFVGTIGGAIGPVIAGYIFDMNGSYQLAFLFSAALSIIAAIVTSLIRTPGGETVA